MSNPLIVDTPNSLGDVGPFVGLSTEGNSELNGAGVFYDAANTITDAQQGNWVSVGVDAAADALDLLGFLADPFGVLLSAPIGWIIEHIGFLKEALDLVAGDPEAVRNMAATWQNVAAALEKSAEDYKASAEALEQQFQGSAGDAYRQAAGNYSTAVVAAAAHAKDAATAFEVAGAIVGTVRGAIRDSLSQFAADELIEGMAALALAPETFGGSLAAWTAATVGQGASLAARNAAKVTKVVDEVASLISKAKSSARALEDGGKDLAQGASKTEHAAQNAERGAKDGSEAKGSHPGEKDGEKGGTTPESKTPEETRQELGPKYRQAKSDEANASRMLDQAAGRKQSADTDLATAQQQLANATNERQIAAANQRIAAAERHQAAYQQQVDRWQGEVRKAQQSQKDYLKEYRESYKNEDGPIPENLEGALDHAKEGALQGKESANNYGENSEEAETKSGEIDDGSLVGGEGE